MIREFSILVRTPCVFFKTGARHLRDVLGVFDSHTLPPSPAFIDSYSWHFR